MFVKVCGTTSEEDALLAVAMGADAIGFIFAPSPRQIQPARVRDIVRRIPPEVLTIGVFRNEHPKRVVDVVQQTGLRAAQLGGGERPVEVMQVHKSIPYVIKTFTSGTVELDSSDAYGADAIIVDCPEPEVGQIYDWHQVDKVPHESRVILAGGLNPENVRDTIRRLRPFGVDVIRGVESEVGKKDPRKLRAFIAEARASDYENQQEQTELSDVVGRADAPYDWQEQGTG